jgi:hypothetical protein
MITLAQCSGFAGLAPNEIVLGAARSETHRVLLSGYLLNLWRGRKAVRKMIVADIRSSLDVGASRRAADLLIALRAVSFRLSRSQTGSASVFPHLQQLESRHVRFYRPQTRRAAILQSRA